MAVAVLVTLPCLVVAALSYDQVIDRTRSRFRRRLDGSTGVLSYVLHSRSRSHSNVLDGSTSSLSDNFYRRARS